MPITQPSLKLTSLDEKREVVFDRETYVLNEKDLGKAEINLATFQGYNQIGIKVVNRTVNSRDISIVGYILADNDEEMLERKRWLQRIANPLEDFYLVIGDYRLRLSATSTIQYDTEAYLNCNLLARFLLNATAAHPCFTRRDSVITQIAYWNAGFHFPFYMNNENPVVFGLRQEAMLKMVENTGEIDIGMKISISAKNGSVVNPFIVNMLTNEIIQVECELSSGESVFINTNYGEKQVLVKGEERFYSVTLDSDFLQLHTGENYLGYGADAGADNLIITIEYTPMYMEV